MTARLSGGSYDLKTSTEISLDDDSKIENEIIDKEKRRLHIRWGAAFSVAIVIILGLIIGIAVKGKGNDASLPTPLPTQVYTTSLPIPKKPLFPQSLGNLSIGNLSMSIGDKISWIHDETTMDDSSRQPLNCSNGTSNDICILWPGDRQLTVNMSTYFFQRDGSSLTCYEVTAKALRCSNQVIQHCFNTSIAHWYGGYADKFQYWPFENNTRRLSAYVVNDSYVGEIGGVIERYFVASTGAGILVDHDVPLYYSLNHPKQGVMCFVAKYDKYPYFNIDAELPALKYKICESDNLKDVHMKMTNAFIDKPHGIPDKSLFKYPIWSTWAQYKKDINQSTVMEFANAILQHNFSHAQIEIDDDWTPKYGDMDFNKDKFPDPSTMVRELQDLGFRVTVWVHPFFNADANSFYESAINSMLVRQYDSPAPAITPWWDGSMAGILDVSNHSAAQWYLGKLRNLMTKYNISSFKFDAGETSWMPHIYSMANMTKNPADTYPTKWVQLAAEADPTFHQEVRVGYRTQRYPIFVRLMDKDSNWGHNNALKSVIPCVFTYGLLGYPFVLPDMIGGNAYNDTPDPELFVRWTQLNTFLPGMQYSIVPWIYNETIMDIVRKFTEMREKISPTLIAKAEDAVRTGDPIILPLWWIDSSDEYALTIEDEFLVGTDYLIAPVVEQGARSRDIYLPKGSWRGNLRDTGSIIEGPKWLRNYKVDIDQLAYFSNALVNFPDFDG